MSLGEKKPEISFAWPTIYITYTGISMVQKNAVFISFS